MLGSRSRWRLAVGVTVGSVLLSTAPALAATKPPAVKVVVTSRPSSVTATGSKAHPIDGVVVKGWVTPASGRVVLQRAGGRRWLDLTSTRVTKAGTFTLVGQRVPVGRETLRVVRAAVGKVKAVATRAFVVTVRAPRTPKQPAPPVVGPAPVPTPIPPPPPPAADPPVTPTCTPTSAGYLSPLMVSITSVLGYVGQDWGSTLIVDNQQSSWAATVEGTLPPGIIQRPDGFVGTPLAAGVYRFSVVVSDRAGHSVALPVCLQFAEPLRMTSSTMPTAQVGQAYDQPLPLAGGFLPLWLDEVWQPALAGAGFTLVNSVDLSGTPTLAGARTLSFRFRDPAQQQTDLAVTVPIAPLPPSPRTWAVPGDSPTIQGAIDQARPGDSIVVGPGIYRGSLTFRGKDVVLQSSAGADRTVLQGDGLAPVVQFDSGESRDAVIDGFTIRGGIGLDGGFRGGGIDVYFASPTIEHDVIVDNSATYGGGIGVFGGSPAILGNRIAGNIGDFGGGLFLGATVSADVRGNLLEGNNEPRYGREGGGANVEGRDLVFEDNVIRSNQVTGYSNGEGAAGLFVNGSPGMRIVDDLVVGNIGFEAVVVAAHNQAVGLLGLTIADNAGIGLFLGDDYGRVTVKGTVVSGTPDPVGCGSTAGFDNHSQPATFDHDDIAGAAVPAACGFFSAAAGDLTAVPSFDDGGYVPAARSSLVDAGAADPLLPATDAAGNPRVVDGNGDGVAVVDIGALERR